MEVLTTVRIEILQNFENRNERFSSLP